MPPTSPRALVHATALITLALAAPIRADDCDEKWLTDLAPQGQLPYVYVTTLWDPDGEGPLGQQLVAGGDGFAIEGSRWIFEPIARWDGTSWQAFPPLPPTDRLGTFVESLAVLPDGSLVAGGNFNGTLDFTTTLAGVARLTGTGWEPLGVPVPIGGARRLATLADGTLLGVGSLDTGTGTTRDIARWTGSVWQPLPNFYNVFSRIDVLLPEGNDLLVGGRITSTTVPDGEDFLRWTGPFPGTWNALPAPGETGQASYVRSMTRLPNGDVVVGGRLDDAGTRFVARWDGQSWTPMNDGLDGIPEISSIYARPDGTLFAGSGRTSQPTLAAAKLFKWSGTAWDIMATLDEGSSVLTLGPTPDGGVVAGGTFRRITQGGVTLTTGGILRLGTPIPVFARTPVPPVTCPGGTATFTAVIREFNSETFQWQIRDNASPTGWRSLTDGNADGFTFAGTSTTQLSITPDGLYRAETLPEVRVLASNLCGTATSASSTVRPCPADWDCSGGVDGDDISAFFTDWQQGNADADLSGATDGNDITAFFNAWQRGRC